MERNTPISPDPRVTVAAPEDSRPDLAPRNGNGTVHAPWDVPVKDALARLHRPFWLGQAEEPPGGPIRVFARDPRGADPDGSGRVAYAPALPVENLGDPGFAAEHGLRYPCVAGAMANGIASVELVEAMGHGGMLGVFGAAGLAPAVVEAAIDRLSRGLGDLTFGFNLIHSPQEPDLEAAIVDLYLRRGVRLVEASAYLDLTLPVVRYRVAGIARDASGRVVAPNRVIAKVSRVEVAAKFMAPPPAAMLRRLVESGDLSPDQAAMAAEIPMAQDVTAEADSGGHTDNRPAITLLPTIAALRDRLQAQYRYPTPVRVGAAGGIATPASAAASFAMGASYIVTGSVNQACVESGSSDEVRAMLAQAEQADTIMAPAADMFEMGVRVQVLKRGTMFAMRAAKLLEIYRARDGLADIPAEERSTLEKTIFRAPLESIWEETRAFFARRDPGQLERAARDAKHKMALVFRWYLGQSSRWANAGDPSRKVDYQVWCGPSMGAFNEWAKGSPLERPEGRRVVTVAYNLLYGAAVLLRAFGLRTQGIRLPADFPGVAPLGHAEVAARLIP